MTFSKIHPPVAQMPPMEIHPWLLTPRKMHDNHLYVFYRLAFISFVIDSATIIIFLWLLAICYLMVSFNGIR